MEYAPRLPFGASLTSWGISTIMIIGSLAISANKRNTSKDKRTVPLSSPCLTLLSIVSDVVEGELLTKMEDVHF